MTKVKLESQLLVLVTLGLVAFGLVMVYSATSAPAALARTDPMSYLKKQGVYALIGVALMMVAARSSCVHARRCAASPRDTPRRFRGGRDDPARG